MKRAITLPRDGGDPLDEVYQTIEAYYSSAVAKHGATPRGVDWTCVATQELRFVQLVKICDFATPFSLNDSGCGYGALLAYLSRRHPAAVIDYLGTDLSPAMIRHAKRRWRRPGVRFVVAGASPRIADYSLASGVFNVRLDQPDDIWERFVACTLADLSRTSRRGFAVNFMAPEAPGRPAAAELYRTPPAPWVRYCERELRCSVEVRRGYGLREFTLLARKGERLK